MEPTDAMFLHATVSLQIAGQNVTVSMNPAFGPPPTALFAPAMPEGAAQAAPPQAPGDRIQNLLELIQKFGPIILSLLKLFGVKATPAEIAAALQAFHALNDQG